MLPPDKSILHRLLIIGSLTDAVISATYSGELPDDVNSTIRCLTLLGVRIDLPSAGNLVIHGAGINGLRQPKCDLDCGNSGTTARLLAGALAGQPVTATLTGDASLSERPMRRLANLINRNFNSEVCLWHHEGLPVTVHGKPLHPATVKLIVASAQIKSALLLAALQTYGTSQITEPTHTRDHTERMLQAFGVSIQRSDTTIEIQSDYSIPLKGNIEYAVSSDLSAAYYLIVAATIAGNASVRLTNVSLNPTRIRFLEILSETFKNIAIENIRKEWNEHCGDIIVTSSDVRSLVLTIKDSDIAALIDEIPLLAILAARCDGRLEVRDAEELRLKESDRIRLIVSNLKSFGVNAEEFDDGFVVEGNRSFVESNVQIQHSGDHRIAMAFAVIGSGVTIPDRSVVNVSFPGFFEALANITGNYFSAES